MVIPKPGCGIVYGKHEMDRDLVKSFVLWLGNNGNEIGISLSKYEPGSLEFSVIWQEATDYMPHFAELQDEFIQTVS